MIYYGAYGSNLNKLQMKKRCPLSKAIKLVGLDEWRLVFKGVADIERKKNSKVYLGIYSISLDCEDALDYYEDFPKLYKKKYININFLGKRNKVMLYVMNKKYRYAVPTRKYFNAIVEGYKDWKIDYRLLINTGYHSIQYNTYKGYKSENWKDKKFINQLFLKKFKY